MGKRANVHKHNKHNKAPRRKHTNPEICVGWSRMLQGGFQANAPMALFSVGTCSQAELNARDVRVLEWLKNHESEAREACIANFMEDSTGSLEKKLQLGLMNHLQNGDHPLDSTTEETWNLLAENNFAEFVRLSNMKASLERKKAMSLTNAVSASVPVENSDKAPVVAASPRQKRRRTSSESCSAAGSSSEKLFPGLSPVEINDAVSSAIKQHLTALSTQHEAKASAQLEIHSQMLLKHKKEIQELELKKASQQRSLDKISRELAWKEGLKKADAVMHLEEPSPDRSSPSVSRDQILSAGLLQNVVTPQPASEHPSLLPDDVEDVPDEE